MHVFLLIAACGGAPSEGTPPTSPTTPAPTGATASTGGTADTAAASEACSLGELVFTAGVGAYAFEPIGDGAVLTVIQGPQGGYHVDWAGLVAPVPDVGVILLPTVTLDDGTVFATTERGIQDTFDLHDAATCTGTFTGSRMFVDGDAASLCALEGAAATVALEVQDFGGRSTATAFGVTLAVDLLDPYDCTAF